MSWQLTFFAGRTAEFCKAYPATDFSNGITDLTIKWQLNVWGWYSYLSYYVPNMIQDGSSCPKLFNKKIAQAKKVIGVFETLLRFDHWLNKATYWTTAEHHTTSKLKVAELIWNLESYGKMKKSISLAEEQTWKFPKFLMLKQHILNDTECFGAPSIFYLC